MEGDATMNSLPRHTLRAFVLVLLFAIAPLPTALFMSSHGLGPRAAWAGGSPDETLKPPLPPHRAIIVPRPGVRGERDAMGWNGRAHWLFIWKATKASVLMRF